MQRAQRTVVVGGFLTFEPETLSAFSQARMNRFQFVLHIYNTYNYLLHITFISPGVKYPFKKVPLPSREERGGSHQPLKVPLRKGTPKAVVLNLF